METKKKCGVCLEEKNLSDFYKLNSSKDGKQSRCKVCLNDANKKSRLKKPKKEKEIVVLSDTLKFCPACNIEKSIDLFYNDSSKKDGLFPKCKLCVDNKILIPPKEPLVKNGVKICSKCGEHKTISSFSKSSKEKSGLKSACKICLYKQNKEYEDRAGKRIEYRRRTKERQNEYNRNYYRENKAYLTKKAVEYNRKFSEKRSERHKKRKETDSVYKTASKIRGLISTVFKNRGLKKNNKTLNILGCTFEDFKNHIESQFLPWMNWHNTGVNVGEYNTVWQLDHIIPMCNATTEEEVYLLNHWSNFQPLCARLNNEKLCDVSPCTNLELNITIIEDKTIIKNG